MRKIVFALVLSLMMPLSGCVKKNSLNVDHMKSMVHLSAKNTFNLSSLDGLSETANHAFKTTFTNHARDYGLQYKASSYYHLKGYISVEKDDETRMDTVYYVFDLFNQSGQRLHRLGGKKTYAHHLMADHNNLPQNVYDDIVKAVLELIKNWTTSQMR